MQILIDISNKAYDYAKTQMALFLDVNKEILDAVKNGIPLPENHGDLIDRSTLDMSQAVDGGRRLGIAPLWVANRIVENADVIIPATKGADT